MSVRNFLSRMRRVPAPVFAMAVVAALSSPAVSCQSAMAQSAGADAHAGADSYASLGTEFASSAAQPDSTTGEAMALPAEPAAGAAGQAEGSYGSHGGRWHSRLAFEAGGGVNAPIGNDIPFITWGGNLTVGAGLRVSKHLSGLIEYQFIDDKLPGGLIADAGAEGGNAHIWSVTLAPVYSFFPKRKNDMYVTGGGGFYRKVTNFTDPEEVEFCNYFCEPGIENVTVSHFSSNQGGANFGIGFTHTLGSPDMGSDGTLKVFAEARYLWINTPSIGEQNGLGSTELIPVTVGLRW